MPQYIVSLRVKNSLTELRNYEIKSIFQWRTDISTSEKL